MKQYPPEEIEAIKMFSLYVKFLKIDGRKLKELKNDAEGNKIYDNLRDEKYMPKPDADPHGGAEAFESIKKKLNYVTLPPGHDGLDVH